jgi:hypothetical protein
MRNDKLTSISCLCGESFCYLCGGPLNSEEDETPMQGCLCASEHPAVYRFYQPSDDHDDYDDDDDYDDRYEFEYHYAYTGSYGDRDIITGSVY